MMLYQHIAMSLEAMRRCGKNYDLTKEALEKAFSWDLTAEGSRIPDHSQVQHWEEMHAMHLDRAEALAREHLPQGSGFDNGTHLLVGDCKPDRLVFGTSFHHTVEGFYDGWTNHEIRVKPSLTLDFDLRVTGRDRSDVKEYIAQCFETALREHVAHAEG
jgi:hypothetical protein